MGQRVGAAWKETVPTGLSASPGLAYGYSLHFKVCQETLKNTLSDKETAVVLAAARSLLLLNDNDAYEVCNRPLRLATICIFCQDEFSTCVGKSALSMGTRSLACPAN